MQRKRSLGWWGVFLVGLLAMGVYIAFEVLDVDGSNLRDPLPTDAIAVGPAGAEMERLLSQIPATTGTIGVGSLSLALRSNADPLQATRDPTPATLLSRLSQIRPRVCVSREARCAHSATSDPA